MNHNFLVRPEQLNQPFESHEPCGCGGHGQGHDHSNGITRRSFIKRTGAVTVATMVAWSAATHQARAEGASGSGSASKKICGHKCSYAKLTSMDTYNDPSIGNFQIVECFCLNDHSLGKHYKKVGYYANPKPLAVPAGVQEHILDFPWGDTPTEGHGECQHPMS